MAHHIARDVRIDQAGIGRIQADGVFNVFQSRRARQAHHAVPGSDVGTKPELPANAPTEALLTIAPLPCRTIWLSLYFIELQTPRS